MPSFFLVGAPKTGTTSLYHSLDQHPAVFMSPIKEPCFFAPEVAGLSPRARELYEADAAPLQAFLDGPKRVKRPHGIVLDWDQYLKLFENVGDETAVGEASVSYLGSIGAPRAIRARIPDARIVMMFRDPVDRLFSHFTAARAAGATNLSFVPWVLEQGAALRESPPSGPVWVGRYHTHLRRYLDSFPERQVRVFLYDDYVRAPAAVLRDLLKFIGVDPDVPVDTQIRRNVTLVPRWPVLYTGAARRVVRVIRSVVTERFAARARRCWRTEPRTRPAADERARLVAVHEQGIRALETLIHRDLSSWLDPRRPAGA